ncbi:MULTISPECIES: DUF305 domain-containing protein [Azohydromonas]|uniref:DUF305 domain-containing protein n=1 Tax=Azohydromonas lata TaxID=45677 RepID=A0ABU5I9D6_9BURK|nr:MULTISPECIES: DUF305 domain-containing protein [Azohydromonas]MDZ5455714.1 DUF305 domain-containing protein [Azohydromonas lata]
METNRTLCLRVCAVALSCLGSLAASTAHAQASAPMGSSGQGSSSMQSGGSGSMDMHGTMMRGMEQMQQMKPTGDADRDFATMMKMHHQQAVEMSQAYLKQAKSPELKKMAQKIVRDQQKEIGQFDKWLQSRK